jgi:hypothetical protein
MYKKEMKRWLLCSIALALSAQSFDADAVGTRRIGLRTAEDFKGGELKGVAIDATGKVSAGLNLGKVEIPQGTSAWSTLSLAKGHLLIATGHEGKLIEYKAGNVKEVAKADAMVLTSIVKAFGTVLVGSLPKATLYEFKDGKLTEWLKLADTEHILSLAYDEKAQALYAATGPEGKLFRITRDKKAQVFFDAEERHLMSVAVGNGKVYAGGGDKAKLYELSGPGRASVLYDFGLTEVRAIAVAANGDVFAIANEIKGRSFPGSGGGDDKGQSTSNTKGKGKLYRFGKSGAPEQLIDDGNEYFTSLSLDSKGKPYVGTGSEGRLYSVDDQHNALLIADTDERQVSALLLAGDDRYVLGSDPVVLHPVRGVGGADAIWTSKVLDLGLRARFGRIEWTANGAVSVSTRSGNTAEPDDTWSPWSAELKTAAEVSSPAGRFVQMRAQLGGDGASLSDLVLSFVTDNMRAVITKVSAETAGEKRISSPDGKLQASGGPITEQPDHDVELKWEVDNPDSDPLRFRLSYQLVGNNAWFDILEPQEKLTKTSYSWDTSALPEGRYRVRVTASDEIANPSELATRHELESIALVVDSTPPEVQGLQALGNRRVQGTALDGVGPIARIEFALPGSDDWAVVAPKDGVLDETSEEFEFDASAISPSGSALISVRVYDSENNVVVRSVMLR